MQQLSPYRNAPSRRKYHSFDEPVHVSWSYHRARHSDVVDVEPHQRGGCREIHDYQQLQRLPSEHRPLSQPLHHSGSMSSHRRVIAKDEELGKRSDDFRPHSMNSSALPIGASWRRRKRWRILGLLALLIFLYLIIQNMRADFVQGTFDPRTLQPGHIYHTKEEMKEPKGPPPHSEMDPEKTINKQAYDGRVRFYRLATSLHAISRTMGRRTTNRNVLFAASSLKSAANLIPLACQMGKWDRNYVHVALFGRDAMSLEEVIQINGINATECNVYLHDARSDYAEYSTDRRAARSVSGAMKHINDFMHPQVMITDAESIEDDFFTAAMRAQAKELGRPLIEIPAGRYEDFLWMTRLDSGSLASWYQPSIDIVLHAPPHGTGGLLRAVKSLNDADYEGLRPPRLTIELPPDIDVFADRYFQYFSWPPPDASASPLRPNTLTLRHRIPSSRVKHDEASLRFLESFYPTMARDNHVLLLSSQTEVTPSFYHYLYYNILEYRYSAYGAIDAEDLLGISLDTPSILADGKTQLELPTVRNLLAGRYAHDDTLDQTSRVPFLYGAPSSTASLIFGEKWAIFHSFLRRRIGANNAPGAKQTQKKMTEAEPAWMEYLLELMLAKGWYLLHPASPLVTVHNDLARIPEEFTRAKQPSAKEGDKEEGNSDTPEPTEPEPFLTAADPASISQRNEPNHNPVYIPLHDTLPFAGDLPELPHLPYVDHTGVKKDIDAPKLSRMKYASDFRRTIGGCKDADADRPRVVSPLTADDLFCLPDMDVVWGDEGKVVQEVEEYDDGEEVAGGIVAAMEPAMGSEAKAAGEDETGTDPAAGADAPPPPADPPVPPPAPDVKAEPAG